MLVLEHSVCHVYFRLCWEELKHLNQSSFINVKTTFHLIADMNKYKTR